MIFSRLLSFSRFQPRGVWQFSFGRTLLRKFINLLCTGPSQRLLCGLRPLVSIGPLPLPVSGGGHVLWGLLPHPLEVLTRSTIKKVTSSQFDFLVTFIFSPTQYYGNCGPEGIRSRAAWVSQYLSKFLMYLVASETALFSHSFASR